MGLVLQWTLSVLLLIPMQSVERANSAAQMVGLTVQPTWIKPWRLKFLGEKKDFPGEKLIFLA
jgi:hypothetical protein